jgi:type I site-specific restriction-modification system R (restriction) subunit
VSRFAESVVEDAALAWLEGLGWSIKDGPEIAPGELAAERSDYGQVVLTERLRQALARLNPGLPPEALDDAFRRLTRSEGATLEARNRALHRMLVDGVTVEYRRLDGSIAGAQARVIDFDDPENDDWLAVNQFTVTEDKHTRRPDIVVFVNGLPLVLLELKNAADENATIWSAFSQCQTYKDELPSLFAYNELLVISDGVEARIGTLTAGQEWFKPWRTISGEQLAGAFLPELQVMLEGILEKRRLLDLLRSFIVFEDDGGGALLKKTAGYHQFHAVRVAVAETLRAARLAATSDVADREGGYEAGKKPGGEPGDRRIGVVWHTQGSGKSLTMAFYAGRIIREPAMENPTIVVLTDRNDLDDQLFGTFSRCRDLLRQPPVQAESRADLRAKLVVEAGGVVFTTIQKFMPPSAAPSPLPSPNGRGNQVPAVARAPQPSPTGRGSHYRGGYEFAGLVERARQLRERQTPAEDLMWGLLRHQQFMGLKFRRQHQIGDYIVDFYCHDAKLVVELDGGVHDSAERSKIDSRRDAYLQGLGLSVLRIRNEHLLNDPASVLTDIADHVPSPSGRGEGGEGPLSLRRNIVVIADEAHRSQYDFIDGFARHMRDALPNASFIGFTGTPIEKTDANTRAVFGDYISVYDIQRAVEDKATVPIYYESRLAKLELNEFEKPRIDPEFEEVTEGEEVERKEKLKSKWAQLEAVVGAEKRLALVARDILRSAAVGDGRQGDGGLHEPAHLHGPARRDREAPARLV